MATKIITAATALLLGLSTVAFAGTPKTDVKTDAKTDAKTTVKAESTAKTERTTTTYYAIKSTDPNDPVAFHWTDDATAVQNLSCKSLSGASCVIETDQTPVDGQMPTGIQPTGQAFQ